NGGKNSLNRLIRCVCGKKIGPDPRNFNQRVSLGRNDLLIRTFLSKAAMAGKNIVSFHPYLESAFHCFLNCNRRARNSGASANARIKKKRCVKSLDLPE
ncbi:hypothetical protein Q8F75_23170, partial [Klebsiella pneumoniae]|uniref:hypothetical protein n=1 Tax=Klebsiella pneumoniae TaxID=573 RepID=UPI001F4AD522